MSTLVFQLVVMDVDDQLNTLLTFAEKTFKTDEDIEPLRRFVENDLDLSTVSYCALYFRTFVLMCDSIHTS